MNGQYDWLQEGTSCREGHFVNGRCRVTAHDVIFMLDMMMNTQVAGAAPLRAYFKDLESYEATSDFELKLQFKSKTYKNDLVSKWLFPIGELLYGYDEEGEAFDKAVIGTKFQEHWYNPKGLGSGPYRFVEFKPGEYIKLERDPLFPMGGNNFDEIMIRIVKDENQPPRMLQNGDLHIATMSKAQYRKNYLEAKPDSPFKDGTLKSGEYDSHGYTYIGWNADTPLFNDKRVRLAMTHSFNADRFLDEVFLNLGERTTGPLSTNLPHYASSLMPIPFDLNKAKALLDEAGWIDSDGDGTRDKIVDGVKMDFEFTFTIIANAATYKTIGDIFKEDLANGIKMSLRPRWANFLKNSMPKIQAMCLGWEQVQMSTSIKYGTLLRPIFQKEAIALALETKKRTPSSKRWKKNLIWTNESRLPKNSIGCCTMNSPTPSCTRHASLTFTAPNCKTSSQLKLDLILIPDLGICPRLRSKRPC